MRKIICLIGYHKTGTSWFQYELFSRNACFHMLNRKLVRDTLVAPGSLEFNPSHARETFEREFQKAGEDQIVVLAEEELSGNPHNGGKGGYAEKELAERLQRTFADDELHVNLVLRNQPDMIHSTYRQYVKMGGRLNLKRYLHPPAGDRRDYFSYRYFRYSPMVSYCRSVFGEALHVFLYERFADDSEDFLKRFLRENGLEGLKVQADTDRRINASISSSAANLQRLVNHISVVSDLNSENLINLPALGKVTRKLLVRWKAGKRGSGELGLGLKQEIEEEYRNDNRKLAELLGPKYSLETWSYPL